MDTIPRNSLAEVGVTKQTNEMQPPYVCLMLTSDVATMQLTDDAALKRQGLRPQEVGQLLLEVFAEMAFVQGRVHADPHPGNLLVRPLVQDSESAPTCFHSIRHRRICM